MSGRQAGECSRGEGAAWHQLGEGMPGVSQDHQAGDQHFQSLPWLLSGDGGGAGRSGKLLTELSFALGSRGFVGGGERRVVGVDVRSLRCVGIWRETEWEVCVLGV